MGVGEREGGGFPSVQQELLALRTAGPRRGAELATLRETDSLFASYIHHRLRRDLALSGSKGLHRPTRGTCTHDVHTASPSATDTERFKIFDTLFLRRWLAYPRGQTIDKGLAIYPLLGYSERNDKYYVTK